MADPQSIEAMTEDQILDAAGGCADAIRQAETDLLRLAYQWAIVHCADRLDPATAALPGRERARRLGGEGTPEVTEFAAAQLGARIGRSPYAARQLIADALDLQHRHPQLWARVQAGQVRASYARHVCAQTRDLTREQAGYVDAAVVESADGRITWTRFENLVTAKVAQAAPETTREHQERAAKATFAKKCRTEAHGMGSFLVRAPLGVIDALDTAVTTKATQLANTANTANTQNAQNIENAGDSEDPERTADRRRVQAVLELLCGAVDTEVVLYAHYYAGPDREDLVRIEGHGPVTTDWVRQVLGPTARFTIKPVLDLAGQAPVDAYEIPDRHREAVHLMTPADTFPHGSNTTRTMQIDHTIPHDQGGISGIGNYGPMTLTHHRIKTHGDWQVRQPFPGIHIWQDPHGSFYLVDHTGTRQLPPQQPPQRPPQRPRQPVLELWRTPIDIKIDFAA